MHVRLSYFFPLIICLMFVACGRSDGPRHHIGVSQCSDDAWRRKFNEELNRELLFHPDYTIEIRSADDDNDRQAADIDYFIQQKVDLIIVAPNEAAELTPAVSRAFDAGIPVVVADRKVTGEKYTAFVGGDNLAVGHLMGHYLRTKLPEGGKVVEILGLRGSTPTILRHQGMMEELAGDSARYEWIRACGSWFLEQGQQVTDSLLQLHSDIKFIMAQNDEMAIGASQSVRAHGLSDQITIMGVDGLTGHGNGVEAIALGQIDATAVYATAGDVVLQTAAKILEGKPYERNTELATYLIEPDNAPLMNNFSKEIEHQVETVHMLKDRVDYFWQQHNLERALLTGLLAFLAVVMGFIVVLYRNYIQKQRLNASLAHQKDLLKAQRDQLAEQNKELTRLTQQLEEATKAKLHFFTNVSHDFRTPLTLINGPLEQLQADAEQEKGKSLTSAQRAGLIQLAHKNVQVLLRLVNQILDFRKYESGKMELNLEPVDLKQQIGDWTESFQGLAHKKHIRLELSCDENAQTPGRNPYVIQGDLAKLERIYFNLMGNAFKFTPENGRITVSLARRSDNIIMSIADTGPGISVEHIQKIFENFYQIDSVHHEGSGIGLALVKNFVEIHGGTIQVENQSVGTGSIFTITLPATNVDLVSSNDGKVADSNAASASRPDVTLRQQAELELSDYQTEDETITEEEPKPIVLVIDDNADIRSYITSLMSDRYRVITASAGQEGIGKAMRMVPDVIVCDVMMPGMDGIECCSRLKQGVNTSHIPVLMLTACSLDEQRVQGLTEGGADAYMAKPFNASVLRAQIESLIHNHARVRDFFTVTSGSDIATQGEKEPANTPDPRPAAVGNGESKYDLQFLQKLRSVIDKNLSDSDFGVEQLGDEMNMSRAQLYRKCKALTNYSPVELIRNTRLKRAQIMLAQGDDSIAQVAYSVGFTAPSYFTKCYKEYFGEMPNEMVKRKG